MSIDDNFNTLHGYLSQTAAKQTQLFLDAIVEKYTCKSLNIEAPEVTLEDVCPEDEFKQTTLGYLMKCAEDGEAFYLSPKKLRRLDELKQRREKKYKFIERRIKKSELKRTSLSLNTSEVRADTEDDSISVTQLLEHDNHPLENMKNERGESQRQSRTKSSCHNLKGGNSTSSLLSNSSSSKRYVLRKDSAVFNDVGSSVKNDEQHSVKNGKILRSGRLYPNSKASEKKNLRAKKFRENSRKKISGELKSCNRDGLNLEDKDKYAIKRAKNKDTASELSNSLNKSARNANVNSTPEGSVRTRASLSTRNKVRSSSSLPDMRRTRSFSNFQQFNCKNTPFRRKSYPSTKPHMHKKYRICENRNQYCNGMEFPYSLRYHEILKSPGVKNAGKVPQVCGSDSVQDTNNVSHICTEITANNCLATETLSRLQTETVTVDQLPKHNIPSSCSTEQIRFDQSKNCVNVSSFLNTSEKKTCSAANSDTDEAYGSEGSDLSYIENVPLAVAKGFMDTTQYSMGSKEEYSLESPNYVQKMNYTLKQCMHSLKIPYFRAGKVRTIKRVGRSNKTSSYLVLFDDCTHGFFNSVEECKAALASANLNFKDAHHFQFLSADSESNSQMKSVRPSMLNPSQLSVIFEENDSILEECLATDHFVKDLPNCTSTQVKPVHVEPYVPMEAFNNEVQPSDVNPDSSSHTSQAAKFNSSIGSEKHSDNGDDSPTLACSSKMNFGSTLHWEDLVANAKSESYIKKLCLSESDMNKIREITSTINASLLATGFVDSSKTLKKNATFSENSVLSPMPYVDPNKETVVSGQTPILNTASSKSILKQSEHMSEVFVLNSRPVLSEVTSPDLVGANNVPAQSAFASALTERQNEFNFQSECVFDASSTRELQYGEVCENSADVIIKEITKSSPLTPRNKARISSRGKEDKSTSVPAVPKSRAASTQVPPRLSNSSAVTVDEMPHTRSSETEPKTKPASQEISNSNKSNSSRPLSFDSKSSGRRSSFSFQDSDDSCEEELEEWLSRPVLSCSESRTDLPPITSLCQKFSEKMCDSVSSKKLIDSMLLEEEW